MKSKRFFFIFLIIIYCKDSISQIVIKSLTTAYKQNFNTILNSGTGSTLPQGWKFLETGTNANTTYEANNGSQNTGNTYSYGNNASSDRAMGALGSGSLSSTFGASFKNSTGKNIRSITISFSGELWRKGEIERLDKLDFQYSLNATSIENGNWIDINALDFISPNATSLGLQDGNLNSNRKIHTATIQGISIPANTIFWIRWKDFDANGSDDGLGIDDFQLSLSTSDNVPPVATSYNPFPNSKENPLSGILQINFSEPMIRGVGSIYLKNFNDGSIIKTISSSDPSITIKNEIISIPYSETKYNSTYYVEISNGCFRDLANNNYIGISGSNTWNFTTQSDTKLKIVNWNIEWFGHPSLGPVDDALQEKNVLTIFRNINADLFALGEIVDVNRLQNIVSQLPGYEFIISDFCSASTNISGCINDQKLAFVYKSSVIKSIRSYGVLRSTNSSTTAKYNWSNGRFPYLMEADVYSNGTQKRIQFIAIHAKANTSDYIESYNRRKNGATELRDSLLTQFPNSNWIVLGDYNDDLDKTITSQVYPITESSFASFTNESTFNAITLPLSLSGQKSTVSYSDIIDHVTISNEMNQYYVSNSAKILKNEVETWVSNYGTTTSDHYPIYTEFVLSNFLNLKPSKNFSESMIPNNKYEINAYNDLNNITININSNNVENAKIYISDLNGKIYSIKQVNLNRGTQQIKLDNPNGSTGIYIIRILIRNYSWSKKLFIKK